MDTYIIQRPYYKHGAAERNDFVSISGSIASVKTKRGVAASVALCRLRRPGEKSQITEMVETLHEGMTK